MLEAGEKSLDESIALFERGQALAKHCAALLDKAAKNRVIHPNKAARLKSRLAKAANKAKAAK